MLFWLGLSGVAVLFWLGLSGVAVLFGVGPDLHNDLLLWQRSIFFAFCFAFAKATNHCAGQSGTERSCGVVLT